MGLQFRQPGFSLGPEPHDVGEVGAVFTTQIAQEPTPLPDLDQALGVVLQPFSQGPSLGGKVTNFGNQRSEPCCNRLSNSARSDRGHCATDKITGGSFVTQQRVNRLERPAVRRDVTEQVFLAPQTLVLVDRVDASIVDFAHLETQQIDFAVA